MSSPRFNTLVDIYKRSISEYRDLPLFGVKRHGTWEWSTYRELGEKVEALRNALGHLGIANGDCVAVISNNRPEWAVGAYATYGLGAHYVPMYEAQLEKDWEYVLRDCSAKAVFVANATLATRINGFRDRLEHLKHVIRFEGEGVANTLSYPDLISGHQDPAELVNPDPDAIAAMIYTSGTTGSPKGVELTHRNIASNVNAVHAVLPMSRKDRTLSFLPWAHSFGHTCELHCMLSLGASMGIAESVPKIVDNLAEVKPTVLVSVPRIFNKIYDGVHRRMAQEGGVKKILFDAAVANAKVRRSLRDSGKRSLPVELKHTLFDRLIFSKVRERFGGRLRYAVSGGAALAKEVGEFIDNIGITVFEGYGLTETSPIVAVNRPDAHRIGTIGKTIPEVRVVIDKGVTGHPEDGELVVYGPNVMRGYHNLPEENAKVFTEDGGFRTGDMGRRTPEGFYQITGRIKEQYKLENGKYVVPSPLEETLKVAPYIANVMIFGDNKPFNVALIVPDYESLKPWLREQRLDPDKKDELLADPSLRRLFREQVEEHSKGFKHYERIREFDLIPEDFTTENDMLTPSLKVKRRVVIENYNDRLTALYEGGQQASA